MPKKSRNKGKRREREARDMCREHWNSGGDCIRSAQSCGKHACDLLYALPETHTEVKGRKRIVATDFLKQADKDRKDYEIPAVLMKEDQGEWILMIKMKDAKDFSERLAKNFGGLLRYK